MRNLGGLNPPNRVGTSIPNGIFVAVVNSEPNSIYLLPKKSAASFRAGGSATRSWSSPARPAERTTKVAGRRGTRGELTGTSLTGPNEDHGSAMSGSRESLTHRPLQQKRVG